jgi:transposase InsO family protein/transposase-like protein
MKAVRLYIKYDFSAADTVRELGYPSRIMLVRWYREYQETGELHRQYTREPRHAPEQMQAAVDYYLNHGRSISRTVRAMGYPSRETLREWIDQLAPGKRKINIKRSSGVHFSKGQKKSAVIELCAREGAAASVAERLGTSSSSLYKWKKELLGERDIKAMRESSRRTIPKDRNALLAELESLDKQIYRKQLELDILNEAVEIVKKDRGIDPRKLANREKAGLIDALRAKYPLNELLAMMDMSKSSYFYQREAQRRPDKYTALRAEMKRVFAESKNRYGYRRIHAVIKDKGIVISEKVIRRIMEEEQLVVPYKKKRGYSSYKGEITPAVDNLVARDFHAAKPNEKWLTDLTEFHIPAGKVYLSPMIDCFDGMAVSWTIGTSPDAELVNTMLDDAMGSLQHGERPIVHTDRGCHYRWPGWISRMEHAGLIRSMSKKGCSPDNSACEGFFGRIKNEMFYYRSWEGVPMAQSVDELDSHLRWYNEERIKMSLGAMSPKAYRQSIGLTA